MVEAQRKSVQHLAGDGVAGGLGERARGAAAGRGCLGLKLLSVNGIPVSSRAEVIACSEEATVVALCFALPQQPAPGRAGEAVEAEHPTQLQQSSVTSGSTDANDAQWLEELGLRKYSISLNSISTNNSGRPRAVGNWGKVEIQITTNFNIIIGPAADRKFRGPNL